MYYVYIIKSEKNGRFYIGQTKDIKDRLYRHNSGQSKSTKVHLPWKLIYNKRFETRQEAVQYEYYLKSLKNKDYLFGKIIKIDSGVEQSGSSFGS